ncbi:hypothetical protein [Kribbella speibonae]|uniref:hypothetical protein n=1 Tax=Kribbella speibonae TaxID=1572660 RepID=UPI00103DAF3A|nr:hypothetical protein [Kribbella speibonae]
MMVSTSPGTLGTSCSALSSVRACTWCRAARCRSDDASSEFCTPLPTAAPTGIISSATVSAHQSSTVSNRSD